MAASLFMINVELDIRNLNYAYSATSISASFANFLN
ncbi:MAG: hypothetical protein RLZZ38_1982 [Bacteroidota bacterium]|jgi:hypothetical protein